MSFEEIYQFYEETEQYKGKLKRKGYFYPIVIEKNKLYIALPVHSHPKLCHNVELPGGEIEDTDKSMYLGLLRELWQELTFWNRVGKKVGEEIILDLKFFTNEKMHTVTFEKEIDSHFYNGNPNILEIIESIAIVEMDEIKTITENQVKAINKCDTDPKQKVLSNDYLEKSGTILMPFEDFLKVVISTTKDKNFSKNHFYFRADIPHVVPDNKDRTEMPEVFREGLKKFLGKEDNSPDWYAFSRFTVESLSGKGKFFLDFLEKVNLTYMVSKEILDELGELHF